MSLRRAPSDPSKMPAEITLKISERLQSEIFFLCNRIHAVEWSGTLFYKTLEGNLGEENCVLSAEFVYLQDIGSSAYTEYDPSNSDYIKFLMANPEVMDLKTGHIHSHNNMDVFFSGTDVSELVDNAPNHNFYLSLIVNNKNEMTARVAFMIKKVSTIKMDVSSYLEFRDHEGNIKTTDVEMTNEAEDKTEQVVYFFECNIVKPTFTCADRYEEVLKAKNNRPYAGGYYGGGAYGGYAGVGKRYDPTDMSIPDASKKYSGKGYGKNSSINQDAIDDEMNAEDEFAWNKSFGISPESPSGWHRQANLFDDLNNSMETGMLGQNSGGLTKTVEKKESKRDHKINRNRDRVTSALDKRINSFITALLAGSEHQHIQDLGAALNMLDEELLTKHQVNQFVKELLDDVTYVYIDHFPEDQKVDGVPEVLKRSIQYLKEYDEEYFAITVPIEEALNDMAERWK